MRIGYVYVRFSVGGIERNIFSCAKILESRGHKVFVISPYGVLRPSELTFQPDFRQARKEIADQMCNLISSVKKAIKLNLDVVHIHSYHFYPFTNAFFLAGHRVAKKIVATPHLDLPSRLSNIGKWSEPAKTFSQIYHLYLGPRFLKFADAVIALTESESDLYKFWGIKTVYVVPNGTFIPAKQRLRVKYSVPPTILTVTRIDRGKGIEDLLHALSMLEKEHFFFRTYIVGPDQGYLDMFRMKARQLKIERNVFFTGYVTDSELRDYYSNSDIFVMPSVVDTQPVRLLEAMSYGLPIVSTNVAQIASVVKDRVNAFLVPPYRPDLLANAIKNLFLDRRTFREFSEANLKDSRKFSWEEQTDKLLKIYASTGR